MTEAEWQSNDDPEAMFSFLEVREFLGKAVGSVRKGRLLTVATCRHLPGGPESPGAELLEVIERHADGPLPDEEIQPLRERLRVLMEMEPGLLSVAWLGESALSPKHSVAGSFGNGLVLAERLGDNDRISRMQSVVADLTPDVLGPLPFRLIYFLPEWRTSTVLALAQQMYESRDFSAMPILADALQDAGCNDEAILTHCRGPGPHVRGCYCVDAILGKT